MKNTLYVLISHIPWSNPSSQYLKSQFERFLLENYTPQHSRYIEKRNPISQ